MADDKTKKSARDARESLSETDVRELIAREREREAHLQGRAPEGSDRGYSQPDAVEREFNVQSTDPELRAELEDATDEHREPRDLGTGGAVGRRVAKADSEE